MPGGCNLDQYSFAAPARLRVLLQPLNPIKRTRFKELTDLIVSKNVVRFEDITTTRATSDVNDYFNTKSLPSSRLVIEYTLTRDRTHDYLHPLQFSRRTLAVLLIGEIGEQHSPETLERACEQARKSCPTALLVKPILFAYDHSYAALDDVALVVRSSREPGASQLNQFRERHFDFCAELIGVCCQHYYETKDDTTLASPQDLASDLVRPKPQRISSFALSDAHIPPSSPSPGPDRGSRLGIGASSVSALEKAKAQGHGRRMKALGDLLLVCGFSGEAMRHYTEAATIARGCNDYLWQGAALEGIGVAICIMECYDIPYTIPQVASTSTIVLNKIGESSTKVDLVDFLPALYSTTLSLYLKSTTTPTDQVPPIILAEAALRIAKFLANVSVCAGMTKEVLAKAHTGELIHTMHKKATFPPKAEIAAWAMRGYSETIDSLALGDKINVYSGLASILGMVGFMRRRAMFLREIVLALIPALIQARVTDAAGKGVHPAATLAMGSVPEHLIVKQAAKHGMAFVKPLMQEISSCYGIPPVGPLEILQSILLNGSGWPLIRNQVLRDCSTLCEANSDYQSFLQYSTLNLELNASTMHRDDQVRLVSTIPRVLGAARRYDQRDLEVHYWDAWLLRRVSFESRMDSPIIKNADAPPNHFLYNPSDKRNSTSKQVLVQGEPYKIVLTLQNPFEFDIEIPEIDLLSSGVHCACTRTSAFVRAQSTTDVVLSCTSKDAGKLCIQGCRMLVTGCSAQDFYIYEEPDKQILDAWYLAHDGARIKRNGLRKGSHSWTSLRSEASIDILPAMPHLMLEMIHAQSPTISLLDGERGELLVQIRNNTRVAATYLQINTADSTLKPLLNAINSKKQPHEIHELEVLLYQRQAMVSGNDDSTIPGNSKTLLRLETLGKRGFTSGEVTITYGVNTEAQFLRKLVVPVRATITGAIDIVYTDIIPIPTSKRALCLLAQSTKHLPFSFEVMSKSPGEYCLLLIDIRNVHNRVLKAEFKLDAHQETVRVTPGDYTRIILPLKRIRLSTAHTTKAIPSLSNRQFVLAAPSAPGLAELNRTLFWYREHLMTSFHATWALDARSGTIETRMMTLNRRMLNTWRLQDVVLSLTCGGQSECEISCDAVFSLKLYISSYVGPMKGTIHFRHNAECGQLVLLGCQSMDIDVEEIYEKEMEVIGLVLGEYRIVAHFAEFSSDDLLIKII